MRVWCNKGILLQDNNNLRKLIIVVFNNDVMIKVIKQSLIIV